MLHPCLNVPRLHELSQCSSGSLVAVFHTFNRLIFILFVPHSCSNFAFRLWLLDVCTPQYSLLSFDSDVNCQIWWFLCLFGQWYHSFFPHSLGDLLLLVLRYWSDCNGSQEWRPHFTISLQIVPRRFCPSTSQEGPLPCSAQLLDHRFPWSCWWKALSWSPLACASLNALFHPCRQSTRSVNSKLAEWAWFDLSLLPPQHPPLQVLVQFAWMQHCCGTCNSLQLSSLMLIGGPTLSLWSSCSLLRKLVSLEQSAFHLSTYSLSSHSVGVSKSSMTSSSFTVLNP